MTLDEVATLLDSKLAPVAQEVSDIKRHLFGNGSAGLRERIGQIESECRRRGEASRESRSNNWAFRIAAGGWVVTLVVVVFELLSKK
jgi:hypothetical protein